MKYFYSIFGFLAIATVFFGNFDRQTVLAGIIISFICQGIYYTLNKFDKIEESLKELKDKQNGI